MPLYQSNGINKSSSINTGKQSVGDSCRLTCLRIIGMRRTRQNKTCDKRHPLAMPWRGEGMLPTARMGRASQFIGGIASALEGLPMQWRTCQCNGGLANAMEG